VKAVNYSGGSKNSLLIKKPFQPDAKRVSKIVPIKIYPYNPKIENIPKIRIGVELGSYS